MDLVERGRFQSKSNLKRFIRGVNDSHLQLTQVLIYLPAAEKGVFMLN